MGEPPLVSLNQRPLSSAFLHQALLLPPIHSNFPLLIRRNFRAVDDPEPMDGRMNRQLCSCGQSRDRSWLTGARTCLGPRVSWVGLHYLLGDRTMICTCS